MARGRHPTRIRIDPPDEQTAAKYLFRWSGRDLRRETHKFPGLTSMEVFGNGLPLEIDFGCGTGVFTCARAERFPNINILGIDLSQKPLYCAIRRAAALGLNNIKFVRGNFISMLPLFKPQTVSAGYYLFPNPPGDYLRERSNIRRRRFFQSLYDALVPGGRIYFATDESAFFECISTIVTNDLYFRTLYSDEAVGEILTHYRKLWDEKGRCVKGLVIEKEQ